jgi:hypothetical protein
VSQEGISYEEKILVLAWEPTFVDDKEALIVVGLIQVLSRVNFENVVTHLESNWLDLWSDRLTRLGHMAESCIALAVQIWKRFRPLLSNFFKNIWRNR